MWNDGVTLSGIMCKQQDMFGLICLDSLNKKHYSKALQVLSVILFQKNP